MRKLSRLSELDGLKLRYLNANRREKDEILTELCQTCGYHRKHLIRLFNEDLRRSLRNQRPRKPQKRGPKSKYQDSAFVDALRRLWAEVDYMCSKNLRKALPEWLPSYELEYGTFSNELREKLVSVSAATIDRVLKEYKAKYKRRGGTKPGTLLRTEIPVRMGLWDCKGPGFIEADTVAHCGGDLSGQFIWSLTMTDICTQWTETRAVWHNMARGVVEQVDDVARSLPFPIIAFDADNGGEFINKYLVQYFADQNSPIYFTRSRPYRKNDNAHVEQKNYMYARQLLGYQRIQNAELVDPLNRILREQVSLLRNHFYPVRKLIRVHQLGSQRSRIYDQPRTPFERVLESPYVADDVKQRLWEQHSSLNPVQLRKQIRASIRQLLRHASVTSNCEASY